MTNITNAREAIARSTLAMLNGDISYIQGARHICSLLEAARVDGLAEPFVIFVGVSSETDTVPFGWMQDNWHPETRAKHEAEWQSSEDWARRTLEGACKAVVSWIKEQPLDGS